VIFYSYPPFSNKW